MTSKSKLKLLIISTLLISVLISLYVFLGLRNEKGLLTVAFLNVGQGDSIFIESPSGNQVLIDGGVGRGVLRELSSVLKFYDRSLDVVIATHPDADHVGGLVDVLEKYKVDLILEPGVNSDTNVYKSLEEKVSDLERSGKIKKILARSGMQIDLRGGAILEILFPEKDVTGWETNTASIITRLVYGENEFLLTGDSPSAIENYLVNKYRSQGESFKKLQGLSLGLQSDVLKAGHHGSRTSSSDNFVRAVSPEYAVISAGKDNRYGHPHEEVLDLFNKLNIKILRTDIDGRIIFKSDGVNLRIK